MMAKKLSALFILSIVVALVAGLFLAPTPAYAASFVVDTNIDDANAGDSDTSDGVCMDQGSRGCTLQAAIDQANASPGVDVITFQTAMTIHLSSFWWGEITDQVTIDASAVWDNTNDRPGVILDGGGDPNIEGLILKADSCKVHGLHLKDIFIGINVISAYNVIGAIQAGHRNVLTGSIWGIFITSGTATQNWVINNYIGVTPSGDTADPNTIGVLISSGAYSNIIGGETPAEGNVISGNTSYGVQIEGSGTHANGLGSNLIGYSADGTSWVPNGDSGVFITNGTYDNYLGGGTHTQPNQIGGNKEDGVFLSGAGTGNLLWGNTISENEEDGVAVIDTADALLSDNHIFLNQKNGVFLAGAGVSAITLQANSIHDNGLKGIELYPGVNNDIAPPVISSASKNGASGTAPGCSNCMIELFSDASDEGQTYDGFVYTDPSGDWTYSGALTGPNVTATVTDGDGNTSEFSAPAEEIGFVVDTAVDDANAGDSDTSDGICQDQGSRGCTLRAAIQQTNASSGPDVITFKQAMTITVGVIALDELTGQVRIDASGVWDSVNERPGVVLDGGDQYMVGLAVKADGCEVYGLQVQGFSYGGIYLASANNKIGKASPGYRNVLSGNLGSQGVSIGGNDATGNLVQNNYIGVNAAGDQAFANTVGIMISNGAHNNTIGGSKQEQGNLISGNLMFGVWIQNQGTYGNGLGGNRIGLAAAGPDTLPNRDSGVFIEDGAAETSVGGGPNSLAGNLIQGNDDNGVLINKAGGFVNIEGNEIGRNGFDGISVHDSTDVYIKNNSIFSNIDYGVQVNGAASIRVSIFSKNSIYDNGSEGIELANGANGGRTPPTITSASAAGASGTVTNCSNCSVELFSDVSDEGQYPQVILVTDAGGNWSHTGALTGPYITATVTDGAGNTSKFSLSLSISVDVKIYLPVVLKK